MKKIYILVLLVVSGFSFGQTFSFTGTGALTSNGWTTHSGTTGQQTILTSVSDSGNSLYKAGLSASTGNRTSIIAGNSEDVNIPITAPITSGFIYYSVLVKVDPTALNTNSSTGDYSLALTSVASATTTTFQSRIYMKLGTNPNNFAVGVLNNSGGTAAPAYSSTELAGGTTHLLVVKYDLSSNTASLIVNPTPGGTEPTANATNVTGTTAAPAQIAGFVIRQAGTSTAGTGNVEIDEIRVGTTFSSVTPSSLKINQNSIAGLEIYPNPVTGNILNIETAANETKTVAIFDVLGKQVLNVSTDTTTVNVGNLNAGVYIVKITEEGKTATRKLVVR